MMTLPSLSVVVVMKWWGTYHPVPLLTSAHLCSPLLLLVLHIQCVDGAVLAVLMVVVVVVVGRGGKR